MVTITIRCERCGYEGEVEDDGGTVECPQCHLVSEPMIFMED